MAINHNFQYDATVREYKSPTGYAGFPDISSRDWLIQQSLLRGFFLVSDLWEFPITLDKSNKFICYFHSISERLAFCVVVLTTLTHFLLN